MRSTKKMTGTRDREFVRYMDRTRQPAVARLSFFADPVKPQAYLTMTPGGQDEVPLMEQSQTYIRFVCVSAVQALNAVRDLKWQRTK